MPRSRPPTSRLALPLAVALALLGCAVAPIQTVSGGRQTAPKVLLEKASFDHGCPAAKIFLVKGVGLYDVLSTWDLEICGKVRRYECLAVKESGFACTDKTQYYPEDSIPAPSAKAP